MKKFMITIPQPCHENWTAMSLTEKGRFCGSCQKQVIDFSAMTDSQLAAFFKKPAAGICGHFAAHQLNKELTVQRKQIPFARHFFVIAIPAFLLSLKAAAQGTPRVIMGKPAMIVPHQPKAVSIVNQNVVKIKARASTKQIPLSNPGRMIDSTQVFEKGQQLITSNNNATALAVHREMLTGRLGGVSIVGIQVKNTDKPAPLIEKNDNVHSSISIYPNPVKRNSVCKIGTAQLDKGVYSVTLIANDGTAGCRKEIVINKKTAFIGFAIGDAASGIAYLQLVNNKTGKTITEKLIIE